MDLCAGRILLLDSKRARVERLFYSKDIEIDEFIEFDDNYCHVICPCDAENDREVRGTRSPVGPSKSEACPDS